MDWSGFVIFLAEDSLLIIKFIQSTLARRLSRKRVLPISVRCSLSYSNSEMQLRLIYTKEAGLVAHIQHRNLKPNFLQVLDLSGNRIASIEKGAFAANRPLQAVRLDGNR